MAVGVVHLSDIHVREGQNAILGRLTQITTAVRGIADDLTDLLLIVTGDVANSGKREEYAIAANMINLLESSLAAFPSVKFLGTVLIPGNHDCNFDGQGAVRSLLVNSVHGGQSAVVPAKDVVDQLLSVQQNFFEFESLVSRASSLPGDRLFWTRRLESQNGASVMVRCFNTAWMSQLSETSGRLYLPLPADSLAVPDADLVITLFHHPYGWLNPENAHAAKKIVETTSDVVLTGHEHDGNAYRKVSADGATTSYVEGSALQANGVESGFNLLKIDLAALKYEVHQFRWAEDMYSASSVTSAQFARNQSLIEHRFINNPHFTDFLESAGTPFSHPVRTNLKLRDLFVFPDLRVIKLDATSNSPEKIVSGSEVVNYLYEKKKLIVAGAPASGRTSLAKILYEDLKKQKKLVPVFLTAADFRGVDHSQVLAAVKRAFERQYSPNLFERFTQLDSDSKVVIADDWHRLKFSLKGRGSIAEALGKVFGRLILLSDDASIFRQVNEIEACTSLTEYEHCEIKEFGCRLRGELITKWHSAGREMEVDEMHLIQSVSSSEHILDSLIEKGVLPAFPVYILSVLQASGPDGQNVSYGSYGYIYQNLLTTRIARISKRNLGQKFTYLSMIAHRMFETGRAHLSTSEMRQLNDEYWNNYLTQVDQDTFMQELVRSQVLLSSDEGVSFQYKYAYYFFVAKFFQEAMANVKDAPAFSARLRQMADAAYDDENAHILIFYLYLTMDRPLIEQIANNAANLFSEFGPSDLDKDVRFVNALYTKRPHLPAPSTEVSKNRDEYRRQRDAMSEQNNPVSIERTPESLRIDLAFESLHIMGQVLRNFPGNLRADLKLRLTAESYQLGLRTLRKFLRDIEANLGVLRDNLLRHLRERASFARRDVEEVGQFADKLMIGISELAIFAIIKRISFSIGLEDLRDVYKVVRSQAGEDHVPTRLIDLSITLDHLGHLPSHDVRDLEHRVRSNIIVHTVLKILIAEHLSLFPVKYQLRQAMAQLFEFQPRALLLSEKKIKQLSSAS